MDRENRKVVEEGSHKGIEYFVSKYKRHYCGYVNWGGLQLRDGDVHGGWTYAEGDWAGFDCNHLGDVCYHENGEYEYRAGRLSVIRNPEERTEWYPEDVEEECKSAIEKMVGPQRRLERLDNDYKVELDEHELQSVVYNLELMGGNLREVQEGFQSNVFTDKEMKEYHKKLHTMRGDHRDIVDLLWKNRVEVDEQ